MVAPDCSRRGFESSVEDPGASFVSAHPCWAGVDCDLVYVRGCDCRTWQLLGVSGGACVGWRPCVGDRLGGHEGVWGMGPGGWNRGHCMAGSRDCLDRLASGFPSCLGAVVRGTRA